MTITSSLATAIAGLNVAQNGIDVVAHNIANANTEGYVRKVASQETQVLGNRGVGASAVDATRITDRFLTDETRRQAADLGYATTLSTYHGYTQDAFGDPGSDFDIATQIGGLAAALDQLASDPQTFALARETVRTADNLVDSIAGLGKDVHRLRGEANKDITLLIDGINADINAVNDLNVEIERLTNRGEAAPELEDRRDLTIQQLAEKIDIRTYRQEKGTIAIYTGDGTALLDSTPRVVHYDGLSSVDANTSFGSISVFRTDQIDPATGDPFNLAGGIELVSGGVRAELSAELRNDTTPDADQLITNKLRGGELLGLVETRDRMLPALDDELNELADALSFTLNAAHNDGVAWPLASELSGTRTDLTSFAGAPRSGSAVIAVVDGNGDTLLAFEVDVAAAADETALAAQINANLGVLGSAQINADGALEITLADADNGLALAEEDSSITVTDAAGRDRDYGFSHYFGLNDFFVNEGSRPIDVQLRVDIVADPSRLSRSKLDVDGPPLAATLGGPGDNRAILDIADRLDAKQDFLLRGGLQASTTSLGNYAARIVAKSATDAALAEDEALREQSFADALAFKTGSVSGVNLDEEMASLLELQQAYAISARLISVVDEMLDDLLNVVR